MNRNSVRSPRSLRGYSLIEVMVAVLVFALGMLGIASLQAAALRNSQSSFERSQGVMQTYSILDAMRANRDIALIDEYDLIEWTCNPPDADVSLAQNDQRAWILGLREALGEDSCGRIDCEDEVCTVEVRWNDSRGSGDAEKLAEYIVTTSTRI